MNGDDLLEELAAFENTAAGWAMDLRLSFSDIIIKRLRQLGWSQKRLAAEAEITEPLVSHLVHADANCTLDTVAKVLFALRAKADIVESDRIIGTSAFSDQPWEAMEQSHHGKEENDQDWEEVGEKAFRYQGESGNTGWEGATEGDDVRIARQPAVAVG